MGSPFVDITGNIYNRWTVLKFDKRVGKKLMWICKCECGNIKSICSNTLRIGTSKSCGCWRSEVSSNNKRKSIGESANNSLYKSYKFNAKSRDREFKLTKEEFDNIIFKKCFYCGRSPYTSTNIKAANGQVLYNGIDRIDNNIGYIFENCVACCKECNYAKRDLSYEDFINLIKMIYDNTIRED